jgi:hypothetical protein
VITWVGAGTTLVFITVYARRARSGGAQLGQFVQWLALRVLAPASLAAAGFGVLAAHAGHWPELLFFHVGEGAFVFSFLLTLGVRLPLARRALRGRIHPARLSRYLVALAIAELTVLYVAVADMVVKPTEVGSSFVRYGSVVVAVGLAVALTVAYRTHRAIPAAPTGDAGDLPGVQRWPVGGLDGVPPERSPMAKSRPGGR